MSEEHKDLHTKRDAETFLVLGLFLVVLGLPVILGTLWADTPIQKVVSVAGGFILSGIGAGFMYYGKLLLKRLS